VGIGEGYWAEGRKGCGVEGQRAVVRGVERWGWEESGGEG